MSVPRGGCNPASGCVRNAIGDWSMACGCSSTEAWHGIVLSRDESVLRAGLSLWPTRVFVLRMVYTRAQGERQQMSSVMLQGAFAFCWAIILDCRFGGTA